MFIEEVRFKCELLGFVKERIIDFMKTIDIVIVTCRNYKHPVIAKQRENILLTSSKNCFLITTGREVSASENRNLGLSYFENSSSEYVIMIDDDIMGFYRGWTDDLLSPLVKDEDVILVSARLINKDGTMGPMMGSNGVSNIGIVEPCRSCYKGYYRLPTACIAFRKEVIKNHVWFDPGFIGSGYEDTDWFNRLNEAFPGKRMVINNNCKLIHLNEMKNQGGKYWKHNKKYYLSKYPDDLSVVHQGDWTGGKE